MKKQTKKSLQSLEAHQILKSQLNRIKGGNDDIVITEDILDG